MAKFSTPVNNLPVRAMILLPVNEEGARRLGTWCANGRRTDLVADIPAFSPGMKPAFDGWNVGEIMRGFAGDDKPFVSSAVSPPHVRFDCATRSKLATDVFVLETGEISQSKWW